MVALRQAFQWPCPQYVADKVDGFDVPLELMRHGVMHQIVDRCCSASVPENSLFASVR